MNRNFKTCLITGISGSGGSYLAEYILSNNKNIKIFGFYRKLGFAKELKKKFNKRIFLIKNNLNNFKKTNSNLNKIKPDLIFHLASDADVRKSFDIPRKFILNNNNSTLNLLESVRLSKFNPLIIMCSTSEVYGLVKKSEIPIKETQIMRPASPYALSKAFQDLLSQVYVNVYKMNIIITRMFSYTNPKRINLFQSSFADQISKIEKNKIKVLQHGNLKSIRTMIDIQDAMRAYWLTAKKGKIGNIYNIGGDEVASVGSVLKKLISLSKTNIKTKINKKLLRKVDVTLQIPSYVKFKKDTNWKPSVPLKRSLKNLLNYRRKNN